jgi:hypothetical protein
MSAADSDVRFQGEADGPSWAGDVCKRRWSQPVDATLYLRAKRWSGAAKMTAIFPRRSPQNFIPTLRRLVILVILNLIIRNMRNTLTGKRSTCCKASFGKGWIRENQFLIILAFADRHARFDDEWPKISEYASIGKGVVLSRGSIALEFDCGRPLSVAGCCRPLEDNSGD